MIREDLRNIAIIAHVDHGKTTLVDGMLKFAGAFSDHQVVADRVMDNDDIERERGITILAKNLSVHYNGVKVNIIDTPGHADFGGEVERVLKMVNGVLLLVDAAEGPMPQTRFVLQRALELGHRIIVVVNKIDRPDARLDEIPDEVLELLLDLDASEEQLESPVIFCSGREGTASLSYIDKGKDLQPLFDLLLDYVPAPECDEKGDLQLLVSSIDYNEYVGRIAIGRIERGEIHQNQSIVVGDYHKSKPHYQSKVANLYQIEGLNRVPVNNAVAGDIVCISGIEDITIGDTICDINNFDPLPFAKISEPTVEMTFSVNDSPFAGQDGKLITSRHIRERLQRELLKDVSLRVTDTDSADSFNVAGRGEMHLSILIENMRREGYELAVSPPRVLFKEIDGVKHEPIEELHIDIPEWAVGSVIQKLGTRKGDLIQMNPQGSRMIIQFHIPSRGMFGYRSEFLTDTKGEGIMNSVFHSYEPFKGDIPRRQVGSLIAFESGESVTYGLYNAQERGSLLIGAGVPVYEGMLIGISPKAEDLVVNVCKRKHITNMRAAGSDDALRLIPPIKFSLEEALEFLADDELLEVTPNNLRLRKQVLSNQVRAKLRGKK